MRRRIATASDLEAILRIESRVFGNPWAPRAYLDEIERPMAIVELAVATEEKTQSTVATEEKTQSTDLQHIQIAAPSQLAGRPADGLTGSTGAIANPAAAVTTATGKI